MKRVILFGLLVSIVLFLFASRGYGCCIAIPLLKPVGDCTCTEPMFGSPTCSGHYVFVYEWSCVETGGGCNTGSCEQTGTIPDQLCGDQYTCDEAAGMTECGGAHSGCEINWDFTITCDKPICKCK